MLSWDRDSFFSLPLHEFWTYFFRSSPWLASLFSDINLQIGYCVRGESRNTGIDGCGNLHMGALFVCKLGKLNKPEPLCSASVFYLPCIYMSADKTSDAHYRVPTHLREGDFRLEFRNLQSKGDLFGG